MSRIYDSLATLVALTAFLDRPGGRCEGQLGAQHVVHVGDYQAKVVGSAVELVFIEKGSVAWRDSIDFEHLGQFNLMSEVEDEIAHRTEALKDVVSILEDKVKAATEEHEAALKLKDEELAEHHKLWAEERETLEAGYKENLEAVRAELAAEREANKVPEPSVVAAEAEPESTTKGAKRAKDDKPKLEDLMAPGMPETAESELTLEDLARDQGV